MEMNNRTRWYLRAQNLIYVVLVLALLGTVAWLGEQYRVEFDWTANQRNSLSEQSRRLVMALDEPLQITAYVNNDEMLRGAIEGLVRRYQRERSDIVLQFINPDLAPEQARSAGVRFNGTLVIHYKGRREQVSNASEASISQAIARLARERESWAVFMTGHGERSPEGPANFDYSLLAARLQQQGFHVQSLNLATNPLPTNTSVLVAAGPRTEWLPAEVEAVQRFVAGGGNILWFTDPQAAIRIPALEALLRVSVKDGTVVDATTQMMGVADPTVAVVGDYPRVPPVENFSMVTLFPRAAVLEASESDWEARAILRTTANSWRETGALAGNVKLDDEDEAGPLVIGYALERDHDGSPQRAVVLGDGDFASNAFVGNQGNLDLAMNVFNWLGEEDVLLDIRIREAPDVVLDLGRGAQIAIALGFLVVLPIALLATGVLVFLRRRRR